MTTTGVGRGARVNRIERRATTSLCRALSLALVAGGASCAHHPVVIAPVPLASIRCDRPDGAPTCAFVEEGGLGCCAAAADGTPTPWLCPLKPWEIRRWVAAPEPIGGLRGAAHLAFGRDHLCARMIDGTVRCLGSGENGNLAQGSYPARDAVTVVGVYGGAPEGVGALQVGVRGDRTCALFGDGTVRCWPSAERYAGPDCGPERHGASGVGVACDRYDAGPLCLGSPVALPVQGLRGVTALFDDCAVLADGSARCWGDNRDNRLGLAKGASYGIPVPTEIAGFRGPVRQIAGRCAVLEGGAVQCRSDGAAHRDLARIEQLEGVEQLAFASTEYGTGCARAYGRVVCWGDWHLIPLPREPSEDERTRPQWVEGLRGVQQIAVGDAFACALAEGRVSCWGRNLRGQLGDGGRDTRTAPRQVRGLYDVAQISAGGSTACARMRDGRVSCWGALPAPGKKQRDVAEPEPALGLPKATRIVVGGASICALDEHGVPWCWGEVWGAKSASLVSGGPGPPPNLASAGPTVPAVAAEDGAAPRERPASTLSCQRQDAFILGASVYEDEDECLDYRAWTPEAKGYRCVHGSRFVLESTRADGTREWSCTCAGGSCNDGRSGQPEPACGVDPETGQPYAYATLERLCQEHVTSSKKATASKAGRKRYCMQGHQQVIGDCRPRPGAGPCKGPVGHVAAWQCFRDRAECERNRAGLAKQQLEVPAACTVIEP